MGFYADFDFVKFYSPLRVVVYFEIGTTSLLHYVTIEFSLFNLFENQEIFIQRFHVIEIQIDLG